MVAKGARCPVPSFYNPLTKEKVRVRRAFNRRARHDAKDHLRHDRFEHAEARPRRTTGWLTW